MRLFSLVNPMRGDIKVPFRPMEESGLNQQKAERNEGFDQMQLAAENVPGDAVLEQSSNVKVAERTRSKTVAKRTNNKAEKPAPIGLWPTESIDSKQL